MSMAYNITIPIQAGPIISNALGCGTRDGLLSAVSVHEYLHMITQTCLHHRGEDKTWVLFRTCVREGGYLLPKLVDSSCMDVFELR